LERGNAPAIYKDAIIGANDRGVAPKDDPPANPARWAGLGKQPGALPLRIVIQIRKIAFVSACLVSVRESSFRDCSHGVF